MCNYNFSDFKTQKVGTCNFCTYHGMLIVCVSKAKILKPVLSLAHSNALFCGGWFIINEH